MQIAEGTAQQEKVILKSLDRAGLLSSIVTNVFEESKEGGVREKVKINGAWSGAGG